MSTISAVMIVKNEEAVLEKCLQSLDGIDEIIILDTGSTDKTCEIARKFTDKVYEGVYEWNDNFAEARNKALSYATTDWILTIDADEHLVSSIQDVRKAITKGKNAVNVTMFDSKIQSFKSPRLYRRTPEVFWKGAVHNHLSVQGECDSNITIIYGYSPAHKKDPDRALRILIKEVEQTDNPREIFYLAREYVYRKDWATAIEMYDRYLHKATWAPEMAEAAFQRANAYFQLHDLRKAQESALEALRINANFKEAMLFMSRITGPKNSAYWKKAADLCNNNDVLFVRTDEKGKEYYDAIFANNSDMSRYLAINKVAAKLCKGKTLDMACGCGQMKDLVNDYKGFDFSEVAVKIANDSRITKGDIYNYPLEDYDTYLLLECLEHIDDLKVLNRIPSGKKIVLSVPSFEDPSHLRTFTEDILRKRYGKILDIHTVTRFNYGSNKWIEGGNLTTSYILLVDATKK